MTVGKIVGCDNMLDVDSALRRIGVSERKGGLPKDTLLVYVCARCHITHGKSQRMTVIEGRFYCDAAALKKLQEKDPRLTPDKFGKNVVPYKGVPGLFFYDAALGTGVPSARSVL
jgi:hypothetical protein